MITIKWNCVLVLVVASLTTYAQQAMTMDEGVQYALKNNLQIKSGEYEVRQIAQLKKVQAQVGKTNIAWMHGNYNSVNTDNNFTITQSIPFPTMLLGQLKLGEAQTEGALLGLLVTKNELTYQVRSAYLQLSYLKALHQVLLSQDSLFGGFAKASSLRYQTGETNLLEKATAESQWLETKNQLQQNETDIKAVQTQLQVLLNSSAAIDTSEPLQKMKINESNTVAQNPSLQYSRQQVSINKQLKKVERQGFLPDLTVGFFTQSLIGYQKVGDDEIFFDRSKRFNGFQLGVSIPVFFWSQAGRSKGAYYAEEASQRKYEYASTLLQGQWSQAQQELIKNQISLEYYEISALKNASLILQQAQKAFRSGDISYTEYLQALKNAQAIRANYLSALNQYNQTVIHIRYLTGEN